MRNLTQYINSILLEGRTIDEIVVKDQHNKEVDVVYYCYDEESLNDILKKYKAVGKYWIDKGFFLATLKNKSTWIVDTDKEFHVNDYRPNADFFEYDDCEEEYTYKELVELLNQGETMVIVINKK